MDELSGETQEGSAGSLASLSQALRALPEAHRASPPGKDYNVSGDAAIRRLLRARLEAEHLCHADTIIVDELGLCRGQNRVDVVVVNGILHGYEIKSDRDTLRRLPAQIATFSRILDRATLVVGEKHLGEARLMVPPWWGITVARERGAAPDLMSIRKGRKNPAREPRALVELLWLSEAMALLEERGLATGVRGRPRAAVWDRVCEHLTMDEIAESVRFALKARKAPGGHSEHR